MTAFATPSPPSSSRPICRWRWSFPGSALFAGLATAGSLIWNASGLTTVKFFTDTQINETTIPGSSGVLVRTYAAETATTPVRAMLLNPGPLRTAMRKAAMPGEDETTLKTPEDLAPHFVRLASPDFSESGKIYDFPSDRILTPQMAC